MEGSQGWGFFVSFDFGTMFDFFYVAPFPFRWPLLRSAETRHLDAFESGHFLDIKQAVTQKKVFSNSLMGSFGKGSLQKMFCKYPLNFRKLSAEFPRPSLTQ